MTAQRVHRWVAVCFGAMIVATGCRSVVSEDPAQDADLERILPEAWAAESPREAGSITSYLLELVDDASLRTFVTEALEANPDLVASSRRLAAARRLVTVEAANRRPQVGARYNASRGNQWIDGAGHRTTTTRHRAAVGVSWEIDLWGRLADRERAASASVAGQEADLAAARDALGARIVQTWVEAITVERAIAVERSRVEILEQLQATILEQFQRGLGGLDDLAAARTDTEVARATVLVLQQQLETSIRDLEVLSGSVPRAELVTASSLPAIDRFQIPSPASVMTARPDVAAALHRLEEANAEAAAAAKNRLPSLRLSGDLGRETGAVADLFRGGTFWNLVGGLAQPIVAGGALAAERDARRFEAEAAWEDLRSVVLGAMFEVENALGAERALVGQREHLRLAHREAERSTRVFEDRYRAGLASVIELLAARNQETDLTRQIVALDGDILSNRVELALAVGAGIEEVST